jgi:hypothetical protein
MSTLKVNTLQTAAGVEVYTAKAWVNFDGTGTVAERGSGNVTDITDNGTGDYTVNFTTAMTDANYCVVATAGNTGMTGAANYARDAAAVAVDSSSARVISFTSSDNTTTDVNTVNVAIFR